VVDEVTVVGAPATSQFEVIGAPLLGKNFINNPVPDGGVATLEFIVSNDSNGQMDKDVYEDFTNVAFSDDLGATLSGLVAVGLPLSDVCGVGATLTSPDGGVTIELSGGSLSEGSRCEFLLDTQLPADVTPGRYTNTTSEVTATAFGLGVTGNQATAELDVAGLVR